MIRRPDTRALRRAVAAWDAYHRDTRPLSRTKRSDALAGHLGELVEENRKLRGEVLAQREMLDRMALTHEGVLGVIASALRGIRPVDLCISRPDLGASHSANDPEAT